MIDTVSALRRLYAAPKQRAVMKQLSQLDSHCLRFIGLSPFVVIASGGAAGAMDASPRGGEPGFVKARDPRTLLVPDAPGNNRLDTLENIIETGRIGMLFMLPGIDETLRVNGAARLSNDAELLRLVAHDRRPAKLVIEVSVQEAYLHCAKALMRSHLWAADRQVGRQALPTMGQIIKDQTGSEAPAETQEEMLARYAADL